MCPSKVDNTNAKGNKTCRTLGEVVLTIKTT